MPRESDADVIVAVGGDGTVNEVARALVGKKGIRNNTCGHNVKITPKAIVIDVFYVTIEKTFRFAEIPHIVAQLVAGNLTFQKFVKT